MRVLGLTALIRRRRRVFFISRRGWQESRESHQTPVEASKTMEKRYTDSPFQQAAKNSIYYYVLNGFNSELIAYNLSPAVAGNGNINISIIIDFYEEKGIQPSMTSKGNRPDNGMMESFLEILKSEIFYGYEKTL